MNSPTRYLALCGVLACMAHFGPGLHAQLTLFAGVQIYNDNADTHLLFHDPNNHCVSVGMDYSDGDKFKIGYGCNLGDTTQIVLDPNGNFGIGTASPAAKLHVESGRIYGSQTAFPNTSAYTGADLVLGSNTDTRNGYGGTNGSHIMLRSSDKSTITALDDFQNIGQISYQNLKWTIGENIGWGDQTVCMPGSVGIGTTSPSHKLSVNGTIKTKEVIVETTGWADDVFAPDYALPSVEDVAAHIGAKGHLPGVPSAAQIAERGVAVGEMQATLLRKLEEMTLYIIEIERKNADLQQRVEKLEGAR